ncbi:MAG TPA: hypothetical protein VKB30_00835, partial [Candidatus Limnocylindrales bacterium]|nr:hypothetical protein [Candidatus Limnocylindrales bacterium]
GNDTDLGQAGNDFIAGGPGDDTQDGGDGNDVVFANLGRDTTHGGPGNDRLWALLKRDVTGAGDVEGDNVSGDDGNDVIRTRDGELDVVSCGTGVDTAILDDVDVIAGATPAQPDGDCERVRRAAPRPGEDLEEHRNRGE